MSHGIYCPHCGAYHGPNCREYPRDLHCCECNRKIHNNDEYETEDDEPVDDYDYDEEKTGFVFIIDKEKT